MTDPGAHGIHIFDFTQQKYKFISRTENGKDPMRSPQCVALDAEDNIYVTDSDAGKVFVFDSNGKYKRVIGSLKGGEGYFKRPTGIAVDSSAQRIYLTDTLRNQVFVLDMQGNILQKIGKNGEGNGEFNFPTELRLAGDDLIVVDAMNFRVQTLDRSGVFRYAIGTIGDGSGSMFRPKGVAVDSEGDLYVVDGLWGVVQVFNRQGDLLYYFGKTGTHAGEFQLPAGLFIDRNDRIYVVDSYNRRVQVFHYFGLQQAGQGRKSMRSRVLLGCLMIVLAAGTLSAQITGDVIGVHNLGPGSKSPITGTRNRLLFVLPCSPFRDWKGATVESDSSRPQTYTPYTSTTYVEKGNTQPPVGGPSSLCLSCHDGTVAPGTTQAYGKITMTWVHEQPPMFLGPISQIHIPSVLFFR